jgi:hypothetical protein
VSPTSGIVAASVSLSKLGFNPVFVSEIRQVLIIVRFQGFLVTWRNHVIGVSTIPESPHFIPDLKPFTTGAFHNNAGHVSTAPLCTPPKLYSVDVGGVDTAGAYADQNFTLKNKINSTLMARTRINQNFTLLWLGSCNVVNTNTFEGCTASSCGMHVPHSWWYSCLHSCCKDEW